MTLLVILNPHAAGGRAAALRPSIESLFAQHGLNIQIQTTEYPGHGRELAATADFNKLDGLVAAGGDGTVFEVLNGYFQNPGAENKPVPLGILPIGTGNAFVKDLDLNRENWQKGVEIIAENRPAPVDVARFKCEGQVRYYLNILGMGFVSDVAKTAFKLKFLGNFSYTLGVLYQVLFLKSHSLEIELDGEVYLRDNIFVEVSNSRYTSNFLMAPAAKINDGFLDVTMLKRVSRRKLLKFFPKVFTGEHVHVEEVETFQAKRIGIRTDREKVLTPDGELLGSTPVDIECLPGAIEVFCP